MNYHKKNVANNCPKQMFPQFINFKMLNHSNYIGIGNTPAAVLRASPKVGNRQHCHREFSCMGSSNRASHLGLSYMAL